jgi:hypothetical protein
MNAAKSHMESRARIVAKADEEGVRLLAAQQEYMQAKSFSTLEDRFKNALPAQHPTVEKVVKAAAEKHRDLPKVAKFRQNAKGELMSRDDPLYDPERFCTHLERVLELANFSVQDNFPRFITSLIPGDAAAKWAHKAFVSTKDKDVKDRQAQLQLHQCSLAEYAKKMFCLKFQVFDTGFGNLNALDRYTWNDAKSVEANMDKLADAAEVCKKSESDEAVIHKLVSSLPAYWKESLVKFTIDSCAPLSFASSFCNAKKNFLRSCQSSN